MILILLLSWHSTRLTLRDRELNHKNNWKFNSKKEINSFYTVVPLIIIKQRVELQSRVNYWLISRINNLALFSHGFLFILSLKTSSSWKAWKLYCSFLFCFTANYIFALEPLTFRHIDYFSLPKHIQFKIIIL